MKWMEFIKVQTAQANVAAKLLQIIKGCSQCQGLMEARVFRHASVDDCSVFLLWNTERPEQPGSSVGLHLCKTMKQYGLVDHSVWIEKEEREDLS